MKKLCTKDFKQTMITIVRMRRCDANVVRGIDDVFD